MGCTRLGSRRAWMTAAAAFSSVAIAASMLTPAPASAQTTRPTAPASRSMPTPPNIGFGALGGTKSPSNVAPAPPPPAIPTPPGFIPPPNVAATSPAKAAVTPPPPPPHNVPLPASALPPHSATDPAAVATAQAQISGQRVEIVAKRSETDTTYANPDGTFTTEISAGPVRVMQGNNFVPVDPTLVAANGVVSPRATKGNIALSAGTAAAGTEVAAITTAGKHLGLGWLGALPAPTLSGATATYHDVVANGDLVVTATTTGFEVSLVLRKAPVVAPEFRLPFNLSGMTVAQDAKGGLTLTGADGTAIVTSPAPLMFSAARDAHADEPTQTKTVASAIENGPGGAVLVLRPDLGFLSDPATVYPVTVDPGSTLSSDLSTHVASDFPNQPYDSDTDLKIGTYNGGASVHRTFIRFNDSSIKGAQVTAATLNLYETWAYSCTAEPLNVQGAAALNPGATWNTQPWAGGPMYPANFAAGYTGCPVGAGWEPVDVTGLAQSWSSNNVASPETLAVLAQSETDSYQWKKFNSDNTTTPPQMVVTYNAQAVPSAPQNVTPYAGNGTATITWAAPSYLGNPTMTYYVIYNYIWDAVHNAWVYLNYVNVAYPGTSTVVSGLTNGATYASNVFSWNTVGLGGYGQAVYTPTGPPTAPLNVSDSPGNASATVRWTAPASNGGLAITQYGVNVYNPDGSYAGIGVTACATCTSVVVPGLTNGRAQYFWVYAYNSAGWGAGAVAGFVTPAVAPAAPTNAQGSISTGWYHTLVARPDGTVAAFGFNGYGDLGNNTVVDSHVPVQVTGLSSVVAISTSFDHNLALKSDGTVWAWGLNGSGQLGINSVVDSHVAVAVPGLANMVSVAAGYAHSVTLRADGTVWSFGLNNLGQLGNNSTVDAHTPIQVYNIVSAVAVTAGLAHSVALRGDGTILAWGYNGYGQLGNNTTVDAHVAITVPGLTGVTSVSADGGYDTMATKTDGSLWAFGYNAYGQLGNNTVVDAHSPIAVPGLAAVTQASAGVYHSGAVKADGTLATFGYNAYGQLGNNTVVDSHVPITPTGPGVAAQSATLAATAGTRTVTVGWTAPTATGGDPIASYAANLYKGTPGSGVLTATQSCVGTCTSTTFAGLADNTTYYATVAAVTAAGTGPVATSNPTTTAGDASGAGDRPFFTYRTTVVDDRITAKVNVGTGNLEITSPDLSVPVVGGARSLEHVYNSLALAPAAAGQLSPVFGNGWRFSDAPDRRLIVNADGSVTFMSGSGNAATFAATTYATPAGLDATLAHNGDGTWTMTDHQSAEKLTFRADGLLTADADRNGNTVTIAYPGGGGYETSITGTAGTTPGDTVNLIYSGPGGRLSSMTQTADSVTRTVTYSYDAANNLHQVTDAAGRVTTYNYDSANNLTQITGPAPLNAVTTFGYDAGHRVTSLTQVIATGNAVTTFDYTTAGHTRLTDPDNHPAANYGIDSSGRVTAVVDAKGQASATTYTADAKINTFQNAATGMTSNTYGANNGESLTNSTGATTSQNQATFNTIGQPFLADTGTDSAGSVSNLTYVGPNLTVISDALQNATKVSYNNDGTVASSTDPANGSNATLYGYNTLHQLTSITPPTGNSLRPLGFTYDGSGRVQSATSGAGMTTTYSYDNLDRLRGESHSDSSPGVTYSYDANGNLYQRVDGTGTTTYTYSAANQLTAKAIPGGPTLTYTYDPAGNLMSSGGDGQPSPTTYHYDKLNLVDQITEATGRIDVFAYNADHQRTDTWDNTGIPVAYDSTGNNVIPPTGFAVHIHITYDPANQVTEIKTTRGSSDAAINRVADLAYSYTVPNPTSCSGATSGRVTSTRQTSTDLLLAQTTTYCYDKASRLTGAATAGGPTYNYGYDADGNRISDAAGNHTFNSANQVTDPGVVYDANGNLIASATFSTIGYNSVSQTTTVTPPMGGLALGYSGSAQDERTTVGATTSTNGLLGVQVDTTGGASTYYARDPQGSLVAEHTPNGDYYYVFDGQGSVIALVDPTGTQRAVYTYDPYGSTATATGLNGALPSNPWRYDSGYLDPSGLYHFGTRYYDPTTGRFTQQDRASGLAGSNLYAYTGDNPVNFSDPTGRYNEVFTCGYVTCTLYLSQSDVNYYIENQEIIDDAYALDAGTFCAAIGVASGVFVPGFLCGAIAAVWGNRAETAFFTAWLNNECVELKFAPWASLVPYEVAPTTHHCKQ